MEHEKRWGTVTLKKGLILFHGSNHVFNEIMPNQFFTWNIKWIHNFMWTKKSMLYTYKLKHDIKLLLSIYPKYNRDLSVLNEILADEMKNDEYRKFDSFNIKRDRQLFDPLCSNLSSRYDGLLNDIEAYGTYEVVIFNPEKNLQKITDENERLFMVYDSTDNSASTIKNFITISIPYKLTNKDYKQQSTTDRVSKGNNEKCFEPNEIYHDYLRIWIYMI